MEGKGRVQRGEELPPAQRGGDEGNGDRDACSLRGMKNRVRGGEGKGDRVCVYGVEICSSLLNVIVI